MWLLLLSRSRQRHFSTRDPHPCCPSWLFGISTCHYMVYLALPSLLLCGITTPGLYSPQHSIDLHTFTHSCPSYHLLHPVRNTLTSFTAIALEDSRHSERYCGFSGAFYFCDSGFVGSDLLHVSSVLVEVIKSQVVLRISKILFQNLFKSKSILALRVAHFTFPAVGKQQAGASLPPQGLCLWS